MGCDSQSSTHCCFSKKIRKILFNIKKKTRGTGIFFKDLRITFYTERILTLLAYVGVTSARFLPSTEVSPVRPPYYFFLQALILLQSAEKVPDRILLKNIKDINYLLNLTMYVSFY